MGSSIKSLKKSKENIEALKKRMNVFSNHISELSNALKQFMTGDGKDSYWQGQAAYAWCEKAIGGSGLRSVIANYNISYSEFKDYAKKIEKAEVKDSAKNQSKSVIQGKLAQCTGSKYTSSIPANKDSCRIPAVLSTVNPDSVNDDQTQSAMHSYNNLKSKLQNVQDDFVKMAKLWAQVVANTTGDLNKDANNRINAANKRKTQIINLINMLEEEFIGDMVFSDGDVIVEAQPSKNTSSKTSTNKSTTTKSTSSKTSTNKSTTAKSTSSKSATTNKNTSSKDAPPAPKVEAWPDRQPSNPVIESDDGWQSGELQLD